MLLASLAADLIFNYFFRDLDCRPLFNELVSLAGAGTLKILPDMSCLKYHLCLQYSPHKSMIKSFVLA